MRKLRFFHFTNIAGISVFLSLSVLSGCRGSELERTLKQLDAAADSVEIYARKVEDRATMLKVSCLNAASDSLRWEKAHEIVDIYKSFNLDSMSFYVAMESRMAVNRHQLLLSRFDDIYEMAFRGNDIRATAAYTSLDFNDFTEDEYVEYLRLGVDIFKHDKKSAELLKKIRSELLVRDTVSFTGVKNLANFYKRQGETGKEIDVFLRYLREHPGSFAEATVYFNLASCYGRMGDTRSQELALARSSIYDIRGAHRDFQSMYRLALMLLEDRDYERASKYIDVHYKAIAEGFFYPRLLTSGNAISRISSEYIATQKKMRLSMIASCLLVSVFAIIALLLFTKRNKEKRRLQKTNEELLLTEEKLAVTNQIKESYVSRYMMLARRYLGEISNQRLEYKRILKEVGPEELYKRLKQVDNEYRSEKEFYRIFDEAFLGIFPDFIHHVNSLILPEASYDESARTLSTELRILAVIKLGITSSPDIAAFLNCSINTVYAYRAKIRNISCVGKDSMEEEISRINS